MPRIPHMEEAVPKVELTCLGREESRLSHLRTEQ